MSFHCKIDSILLKISDVLTMADKALAHHHFSDVAS